MADELHSVTEQLGNEIIQWRQANLEEWYTDNVETMDQAEEYGRFILQLKEGTKVALGKLFNHVEKHKGGRGLRGGMSELARRLDIPFSTAKGLAAATATKELSDLSLGLGTSKVELIMRAPEPELVLDWVDAQEEKPTKREIKDFIEIQHFETVVLPGQPEGEFNVIVIDPPWKYDLGFDHRHARAGVPLYPTMSLEELETLHVPAAENCALFLWVTNQFIHEGFHLMEHWGFEYKGIITWAKDKTGTGRWFLNQTEHVLLGIRGKIPWQKGQSNLIHAERREHSRKPDEFYDLVERLVKYDLRIDMFSREKRDGWKQWGAEVEKFNLEKGTETPKETEDPPRHTDIETAVRRLFFMPRFALHNIDDMKDKLRPQFSGEAVEQAVEGLVRKGILERVCSGNYRRVV